MIITLTPDIEQMLAEEAEKTGTTAEALALDRLQASHESSQKRNHVIPSFIDYRDTLPPPRNDWERRLRSIGTPCGVSLSNEAVSSEGIYD